VSRYASCKAIFWIGPFLVIAADKAQCMRTGVYLPSYVEWLTCLEMERDVRKMQQEERFELEQSSVHLPLTKRASHGAASYWGACLSLGDLRFDFANGS
jgi:hypothetical protein